MQADQFDPSTSPSFGQLPLVQRRLMMRRIAEAQKQGQPLPPDVLELIEADEAAAANASPGNAVTGQAWLASIPPEQRTPEAIAQRAAGRAFTEQLTEDSGFLRTFLNEGVRLTAASALFANRFTQRVVDNYRDRRDSGLMYTGSTYPDAFDADVTRQSQQVDDATRERRSRSDAKRAAGRALLEGMVEGIEAPDTFAEKAVGAVTSSVLPMVGQVAGGAVGMAGGPVTAAASGMATSFMMAAPLAEVGAELEYQNFLLIENIDRISRGEEPLQYDPAIAQQYREFAMMAEGGVESLSSLLGLGIGRTVGATAVGKFTKGWVADYAARGVTQKATTIVSGFVASASIEATEELATGEAMGAKRRDLFDPDYVRTWEERREEMLLGAVGGMVMTSGVATVEGVLQKTADLRYRRTVREGIAGARRTVRDARELEAYRERLLGRSPEARARMADRWAAALPAAVAERDAAAERANDAAAAFASIAAAGASPTVEAVTQLREARAAALAASDRVMRLRARLDLTNSMLPEEQRAADASASLRPQTPEEVLADVGVERATGERTRAERWAQRFVKDLGFDVVWYQSPKGTEAQPAFYTFDTPGVVYMLAGAKHDRRLLAGYALHEIVHELQWLDGDLYRQLQQWLGDIGITLGAIDYIRADGETVEAADAAAAAYLQVLVDPTSRAALADATPENAAEAKPLLRQFGRGQARAEAEGTAAAVQQAATQILGNPVETFVARLGLLGQEAKAVTRLLDALRQRAAEGRADSLGGADPSAIEDVRSAEATREIISLTQAARRRTKRIPFGVEPGMRVTVGTRSAELGELIRYPVANPKARAEGRVGMPEIRRVEVAFDDGTREMVSTANVEVEYPAGSGAFSRYRLNDVVRTAGGDLAVVTGFGENSRGAYMTIAARTNDDPYDMDDVGRESKVYDPRGFRRVGRPTTITAAPVERPGEERVPRPAKRAAAERARIAEVQRAIDDADWQVVSPDEYAAAMAMATDAQNLSAVSRSAMSEVLPGYAANLTKLRPRMTALRAGPGRVYVAVEEVTADTITDPDERAKWQAEMEAAGATRHFYLTGLTNDEEGVSGAARSFLLWAIENLGAKTDTLRLTLDCFAVPIGPQIADGELEFSGEILPDLYRSMGFRETWRAAFDPQYWDSPLSIDDALAGWDNQSRGGMSAAIASGAWQGPDVIGMEAVWDPKSRRAARAAFLADPEMPKALRAAAREAAIAEELELADDEGRSDRSGDGALPAGGGDRAAAARGRDGAGDPGNVPASWRRRAALARRHRESPQPDGRGELVPASARAVDVLAAYALAKPAARRAIAARLESGQHPLAGIPRREQLAGRDTSQFVAGAEAPAPLPPPIPREQYNTTAAAYELLNERTRELTGIIRPDDRSQWAVDTIARVVAAEVADHVAKFGRDSGWGWYSTKIAATVAVINRLFPETTEVGSLPHLKVMLALAVSSNGETVATNIANTVKLYAAHAADQPLASAGTGGVGGGGVVQTIQQWFDLFDSGRVPWEDVRDIWMSVGRVGDSIERFKGIGFRERATGDKDPMARLISHPGTMSFRAAGATVMFGPKIGTFLSNLYGVHDVLTADRWWARSVDRIRGTNGLYDGSTHARLIYKLRAMMQIGMIDVSKYGYTERDVLEQPELRYDLARQVYDEFVANGFKAPTLAKKTFGHWGKSYVLNATDINTQPRIPDWGVYARVTDEVMGHLRARGIDMTVADMQAVEWFHEKRLVDALGLGNEKNAPADYASATVDMVRKILPDARGRIADPRLRDVFRSAGVDPESVAATVADAEQAGWEEGGLGRRIDALYNGGRPQGRYQQARERLRDRPVQTLRIGRRSALDEALRGERGVPKRGTIKQLFGELTRAGVQASEIRWKLGEYLYGRDENAVVTLDDLLAATQGKSIDITFGPADTNDFSSTYMRDAVYFLKPRRRTYTYEIYDRQAFSEPIWALTISKEDNLDTQFFHRDAATLGAALARLLDHGGRFPDDPNVLQFRISQVNDALIALGITDHPLSAQWISPRDIDIVYSVSAERDAQTRQIEHQHPTEMYAASYSKDAADFPVETYTSMRLRYDIAKHRSLLVEFDVDASSIDGHDLDDATLGAVRRALLRWRDDHFSGSVFSFSDGEHHVRTAQPLEGVTAAADGPRRTLPRYQQWRSDRTKKNYDTAELAIRYAPPRRPAPASNARLLYDDQQSAANAHLMGDDVVAHARVTYEPDTLTMFVDEIQSDAAVGMGRRMKGATRGRLMHGTPWMVDHGPPPTSPSGRYDILSLDDIGSMTRENLSDPSWYGTTAKAGHNTMAYRFFESRDTDLSLPGGGKVGFELDARFDSQGRLLDVTIDASALFDARSASLNSPLSNILYGHGGVLSSRRFVHTVAAHNIGSSPDANYVQSLLKTYLREVAEARNNNLAKPMVVESGYPGATEPRPDLAGLKQSSDWIGMVLKGLIEHAHMLGLKRLVFTSATQANKAARIDVDDGMKLYGEGGAVAKALRKIARDHGLDEGAIGNDTKRAPSPEDMRLAFDILPDTAQLLETGGGFYQFARKSAKKTPMYATHSFSLQHITQMIRWGGIPMPSMEVLPAIAGMGPGFFIGGHAATLTLSAAAAEKYLPGQTYLADAYTPRLPTLRPSEDDRIWRRRLEAFEQLERQLVDLKPLPSARDAEPGSVQQMLTDPTSRAAVVRNIDQILVQATDAFGRKNPPGSHGYPDKDISLGSFIANPEVAAQRVAALWAIAQAIRAGIIRLSPEARRRFEADADIAWLETSIRENANLPLDKWQSSPVPDGSGGFVLAPRMAARYVIDRLNARYGRWLSEYRRVPSRPARLSADTDSYTSNEGTIERGVAEPGSELRMRSDAVAAFLRGLHGEKLAGREAATGGVNQAIAATLSPLQTMDEIRDVATNRIGRFTPRKDVDGQPTAEKAMARAAYVVVRQQHADIVATTSGVLRSIGVKPMDQDYASMQVVAALHRSGEAGREVLAHDLIPVGHRERVLRSLGTDQKINDAFDRLESLARALTAWRDLVATEYISRYMEAKPAAVIPFGPDGFDKLHIPTGAFMQRSKNGPYMIMSDFESRIIEAMAAGVEVHIYAGRSPEAAELTEGLRLMFDIIFRDPGDPPPTRNVGRRGQQFVAPDALWDGMRLTERFRAERQEGAFPLTREDVDRLLHIHTRTLPTTVMKTASQFARKRPRPQPVPLTARQQALRDAQRAKADLAKAEAADIMQRMQDRLAANAARGDAGDAELLDMATKLLAAGKVEGAQVARVRYQRRLDELAALRAQRKLGRRDIDRHRRLALSLVRLLPRKLQGGTAGYVEAVGRSRDLDIAAVRLLRVGRLVVNRLARAEYRDRVTELRKAEKRIDLRRVRPANRPAIEQALLRANGAAYDKDGIIRKATTADYANRATVVRDAVEEALDLYQQERDDWTTSRVDRANRLRAIGADVVRRIRDGRKPVLREAGSTTAAGVAAITETAAMSASDLDAITRRLDGSDDGPLRRLYRAVQSGETAYLGDLRDTLVHLDGLAEAAGYRDWDDLRQRSGMSRGVGTLEYRDVVLGGRSVRVTLGQYLKLLAIDEETMDAIADSAAKDAQGLPIREGSGIKFGDGRDAETIHGIERDELDAIRSGAELPLYALVTLAKMHREDVLREPAFDAHYRMKGYRPPMVPGYEPRSREGGSRDFDIAQIQTAGQAAVAFIENAGFTKARTGGGDPILIGDFTADYLRSIEGLLRLTHMAEPVRDMWSIVTGQQIREAINAKFGARVVENIRHMLVHGAGMAPSFTAGPINVLGSMATQSALAFNPSTWFKVLGGGIANLLADMSPSQVAAGVAGAGSVEMAEIEQASGYLWARNSQDATDRRSMTRDDSAAGVSLAGGLRRAADALRAAGLNAAVAVTGEAGGARVSRRSSVGSALREFSRAWDPGVMSALDRFVIRVAVAGHLRDVEGEMPTATREQQLKEAARRAELTIRRTQNVSSPLDDSAVAARTSVRQDGLTRALMPFSSDPLKQAARLYEGLDRNGAAGAARFVGVASLNAMIGVAAKYLVAAAKSAMAGDDEEAERLYQQAVLESSTSNIPADVVGELVGRTGLPGFLLGADLAQLLIRRASGQQGYAPEVQVLAAEVVTNAIETADRLAMDDERSAKDVWRALTAAAAVTGLPSPLMRLSEPLLPEDPVEALRAERVIRGTGRELTPDEEIVTRLARQEIEARRQGGGE